MMPAVVRRRAVDRASLRADAAHSSQVGGAGLTRPARRPFGPRAPRLTGITLDTRGGGDGAFEALWGAINGDQTAALVFRPNPFLAEHVREGDCHDRSGPALVRFDGEAAVELLGH